MSLQGNCVIDTSTTIRRALLKNPPGMLFGKKVSLCIPKSKMWILGVVTTHMGFDLENLHWSIPAPGKLYDEAPQILLATAFKAIA